MLRIRTLCETFGLLLLFSTDAWAQQVRQAPFSITTFPRGPGFYFSTAKIIVFLLIYLLWVRSVDWMNIAAVQMKMKALLWNYINVFVFVLAVMIALLAPGFWFFGLPCILLAWVVPFTIFVSQYNGVAEDHHRVFTNAHLRFWFSQKLRPLGIRIAAEVVKKDEGPPVEFKARGAASDPLNEANLLRARQLDGFLTAREIFFDCVSRRGHTILMDYTQTAVAIRYQVDGVWHNSQGLERPIGDSALEALKYLAALNPADRRSRQQGTFEVKVAEKKFSCKILTLGTKTGEQVLIHLDDGKLHDKRLPDIGMREKLVEQLKGLLAEKSGVAIISAPPSGGLSVLLPATVASMDRYMRGFMAIEPASTKELKVENVPVTTFNDTGGETPLTFLPKLLREYPDVLVVPNFFDAQSAELLLKQPAEGRFVITTARVKEAVQAILQVAASVKIPPAKLAQQTTVVVTQRLIRKLCEKCKEAYAPPPQLLKQLGLPPDKIEALYRPHEPNPEEKEEICSHCGGLGYYGRTALFEVLAVTDPLRQAYAANASPETLRQIARKEGMKTFQEEGILLAVKGVTSLQELMRILKE